MIIARRPFPLFLGLVTCLSCAPLVNAGAPSAFRVCADPNNLPFSDAGGNGFENKIADLLAGERGETVAYTWWAQRRGFVRNTLKAEACDVIIGVPAHYDLVLTTRPYYRSTYVLVSRADRKLDITSLRDERLRHLRIGVHLIGDDGMNTPPTHALGEQGIVENVIGYPIYGDYRQQAPPARLIEAVQKGDIDVAVPWGPLAGYAAQRSGVPLHLAPVADGNIFAPLRFQFDIGMGVRKGDKERAEMLNRILIAKADEIRSILNDYGVPLVQKAEE